MQEKKNFAFLLPKTENVLESLIRNAPFLKKYTMVGGSALSLHLRHRKSEDLDFFTYCSGNFSKNEIRSYLSHLDQKEIINESSDQIDLLVDGVKTTFFDAKWSFLEPVIPLAFNLATIESIAAMKVNVLFMRAKYRDYYDLYFLAKQLGLRSIFEHATKVVSGLTYKLFCVSLLYIDDIVDDNIDHLQPVDKISKEQIRNYFEERIKVELG